MLDAQLAYLDEALTTSYACSFVERVSVRVFFFWVISFQAFLFMFFFFSSWALKKIPLPYHYHKPVIDWQLAT
jgi:hypothetical protein